MGIGLAELAEQNASPEPERNETAPAALARGQSHEREAKCRAEEVYKRWQRNTIATSDLQRQLLQGIKGDTSYRDLLLIAAEALALTTDNDLIYKQVLHGVQQREQTTDI